MHTDKLLPCVYRLHQVPGCLNCSVSLAQVQDENSLQERRVEKTISCVGAALPSISIVRDAQGDNFRAVLRGSFAKLASVADGAPLHHARHCGYRDIALERSYMLDGIFHCGAVINDRIAQHDVIAVVQMRVPDVATVPCMEERRPWESLTDAQCEGLPTPHHGDHERPGLASEPISGRGSPLHVLDGVFLESNHLCQDMGCQVSPDLLVGIAQQRATFLSVASRSHEELRRSRLCLIA